ncbi:MAG: glycosyltransferase family 2 protein [Bacteroidaceae bacterium]|nr:glycosyltransferase family 2 protein [Bacteroidaceae bacterium]
MQLSILIPTHDYNAYPLVYSLHEQAEALGISYEIILVEDGSRDPVTMIANLKTKDLSNCKYIRQEGMGQAHTRNKMAEMAEGDWLLFIDSDAKACSNDFIRNYIDSFDKAEVIIGGLVTPDLHLNPEVSLRYRYEAEADKHRSAEERNKAPYGQFTAFNMLMRRTTFLSVMFDKDCHEYGYEDALFGVELNRRGISVLHIDNPLIHAGIDTNDVFLRKTETSLRTLKGLKGKMLGNSKIENSYARLQSLHLLWAMRLFHKCFAGTIKQHLLGKSPSLFWFSVYKLGYYSCL